MEGYLPAYAYSASLYQRGTSYAELDDGESFGADTQPHATRQDYAAWLREASQADPKHFVELILAGEVAELAALMKAARLRLRRDLEPGDMRGTDWHTRLHDAHMYSSGDPLYEITRDFTETAKLYGKIIISEMHLPDQQKSIAPASLGGIAGGQKFVVANIVFKFARDVVLESGGYLYGGSCPDEVAAHKAAGHERKAINWIMKRNFEGLSTPLMTLVDYRGHRLSAQSMLPIGPDTLIYGSADAGKTILTAENSPHLPKIQRLAAELHLAEHRVTNAQGDVKSICLSTDIEVHRSLTDPALAFCIDTARLLPPMAPQRPRDIYSRLFRPEWLMRYAKPLSSDACSGFGRLDAEIHRAAIVEATRVMLEETIPNVAGSMKEANVQDICAFLQERGVNLRYLGRVRTHCPVPAVRVALLAEMVARVTQKHLRALWRGPVAAGISSLPLLKIAAAELNSVRLGGEPEWLRRGLHDKYGGDAPPADEPLSSALALRRICELSGLQVASAAMESPEPLTVSDLEMDARIKELGVIPHRCSLLTFATPPPPIP
jgi:hypothetical protein